VTKGVRRLLTAHLQNGGLKRYLYVPFSLLPLLQADRLKFQIRQFANLQIVSTNTMTTHNTTVTFNKRQNLKSKLTLLSTILLTGILLSFTVINEIGQCYISFKTATNFTFADPEQLLETSEKVRTLKTYKTDL
jgi:hypothetical protein